MPQAMQSGQAVFPERLHFPTASSVACQDGLVGMYEPDPLPADSVCVVIRKGQQARVPQVSSK
jgi:hypothetical protein